MTKILNVWNFEFRSLEFVWDLVLVIWDLMKNIWFKSSHIVILTAY